MALTAAPGEKYTIRRKVFKIFGAGFHIYDAQGKVVGYSKQKAFRLREDIRIYTDESCSKELVSITTKQILDISGTYTMSDASGNVIGSLQREGLSSLFFRDSWKMFSAEGKQLATLKEDSGFMGFVRRYIELAALFWPQRFLIARTDGTPVARFRQHFNWFIYRLGVEILPAADAPGTEDDLDELFLLASACLVAAIEGRQQGG